MHLPASLLLTEWSPFLLFAGVALGVSLLQVGDGQPGVVLEGVEVFVPEQFLDVIDVGSTPDQFGGATAAEGVG